MREVNMQRRILHIDMDAFFASVEQVRNPSLKGKPVIVGGDIDARGVVSTASYEARTFGVHSAMPLSQAHRLCPHGIYLRGHFEDYRAASEKVGKVLDTVSPLVEFMSIDEAYVDISGSLHLFGNEDQLAAYIKKNVFEKTQLPCTIGIASNKMVAKIATDQAKPDGYLSIKTGDEETFLHPLPVGVLPGIGPKAREILESLGIHTVGCLADLSIDTLLQMYGPSGYALHQAAHGISTAPVITESTPKSISRETTFEKDLLDWNLVEQMIAYLAERAMFSLRQNGLETGRVTLKVRYADFLTHTFARTLNSPTSVDSDIIHALQLLIPKAKERRARIRLVGVGLTLFTYNQHQLALFNRSTEKWERALDSVDHLRERHGFEYLRFAKSIALGRQVRLATPSLSR